MHFCLQWQPVRVINLKLIQHVELAGTKMQMRKDKSVGETKKRGGRQLLWDAPVVPDSWSLLWFVLVLLLKKAKAENK